MNPRSRHEGLLAAARATRGFMPDEEGVALATLAGRAALAGFTSLVEVGAYCGRSTLYLASGVAEAVSRGAAPAVIFSVDHHHGSEENQAGWEHHDATLVNPETGRMDTLPFWRKALEYAHRGGPRRRCGRRLARRRRSVERRRRPGLHRRRPRRGPGLGRLRGWTPPRRRWRLARHSRRVPGPRRRRTPPVRDLYPCARVGRVRGGGRQREGKPAGTEAGR